MQVDKISFGKKLMKTETNLKSTHDNVGTGVISRA